uniref:Uncharacterized protein n=1 Tax=Chromera velia CCMP2878 TaxID=1169474 RepID=A0A0G4H9P5_9ALVE|eukprot:Cvel_25443.t1-p1 / transcript=Cvel_25443.t1 / gene=Cvel_25443 / organism=Chromera_velia_CCMP2878 / gene_product=hypothetical protein / transcript_product=hypothetical protein / location=Cvel_scaffold2883:2595-3245(+) / protein_length=217 / sequence_SO=supercontig / SO=protein_coding / is_pseudo=false
MYVVCCDCRCSSELVVPLTWWRYSKVVCGHCGSSSWVWGFGSSRFLSSPNSSTSLSHHGGSPSVFRFSRKGHRRAVARICAIEKVCDRAIKKTTALIRDRWCHREEFVQSFRAQLEAAGTSAKDIYSGLKAEDEDEEEYFRAEDKEQLLRYLASSEGSTRASVRISKAEEALDSAMDVCLCALDGEIWFRDTFGDEGPHPEGSELPWWTMSRDPARG